MCNVRIRRGALTPKLLTMLALLMLLGTACSDLDGVLPGGVPEAGSEAAEDDAAGDAADDDAAQDDGAADDGAAGGSVEPITGEDVREVCSDAEATAITAEELAPLVNLTPAAFEALACGAV